MRAAGRGVRSPGAARPLVASSTGGRTPYCSQASRQVFPRWLLTSFGMSNIETWRLPPKTRRRRSSALICRRFFASCSPFLRMYSQIRFVTSGREIGRVPTTAASSSEGCIGFMSAAFGARLAPPRRELEALGAVDFRAVDFRAVDFRAVDFRAVDFRAVDFRAVDFRAVDFRAVDFRVVDFRVV
ncbi:MAG: pentapeptide repeat-containing protein, partial [Chloroflexi bacterium]